MTSPTSDQQRRVHSILEEGLRHTFDWSDPSIEFRRRPEWGSLQHMQILSKLQTEFGIGQRPGDVDVLTTPQRILQALINKDDLETLMPIRPTEIDRGLARTYMDETRITSIDVDNAQLGYRGHDAAWLSEQVSYASVTRLLIDKDLAEPNLKQKALLAEGAMLARSTGHIWNGSHPDLIVQFARLDFGSMRSDDEVSVIRHGWRILGAVIQLASRSAEPVRFNEGIPEAICRGLPELSDDAANSLGCLMVLQADHGSSAAAVAVRTTVSAGAPLHHAILAGLVAFGGMRHGGAVGDVVRLIEAFPDLKDLREQIRVRAVSGTPVPGFGHRLYRTIDPRVEPIRRLLAVSEERRRSTWWSDRLRIIRDEHQELERTGVVANVDFYAGPLLRVLGFSTEILTSLFAIARIPGWIAHAAEQANTGTLIRPQLKYVGQPIMTTRPTKETKL